jgi:ABC-2 type transport system permease protein
MSRAIASELLKLRTTRTFLGLMAAAALLVAGVSALAAAVGTFEEPGVPPGEDLVAIVFALVLGALAVTTEFRHGTITPTLLALPSRGRLIAAKLVAHLAAGFAIGLAAVALNLVLVAAILSARGIEGGTSLGEAVGWALGLSGSAALVAGLGVAFGAIVRNQVGALVGLFAWLFVAEPLLAAVPVVGDEIARFGLGGLLDAFDGVNSPSDELLGQAPAGLLLAAYVALLAVAGVALLRRRDVTA